MLFFKKNKIKLSIIEDYIQLLVIDNFFKNDFSCVVQLDKTLFAEVNKTHTFIMFQYNQTLEKLKMNDLSLLLLKQELKDVNHIYNRLEQNNFSNINLTLEELSKKLSTLSLSLKEKQKELKIVPFENAL